MDERDIQAKKIVEKHVMYAAGVGLVPIPYVDMAAVTAVNVKMLKQLSDHYGVEFREDRVKSIITSLLGGVTSGALAHSSVVRTALLTIPLIGHTIAVLSLSIFASAATYAIGKVFLPHFASGGTLLDFDPDRVRTFFAEQYEKGKRAVSRKPAATEPGATPA